MTDHLLAAVRHLCTLLASLTRDRHSLARRILSDDETTQFEIARLQVEEALAALDDAPPIHTWQAAVDIFHRTFGLEQHDTPTIAASETRFLREALIREEFEEELIPAMAAHDLPHIADALADLLYVVLGTAVSYGLPMAPFFNEVHRSNMTKLWPEPPYVRKRPDGKVLKPDTYSPARTAEIVRLLQRSDRVKRFATHPDWFQPIDLTLALVCPFCNHGFDTLITGALAYGTLCFPPLEFTCVSCKRTIAYAIRVTADHTGTGSSLPPPDAPSERLSPDATGTPHYPARDGERPGDETDLSPARRSGA